MTIAEVVGDLYADEDPCSTITKLFSSLEASFVCCCDGSCWAQLPWFAFVGLAESIAFIWMPEAALKIGLAAVVGGLGTSGESTFLPVIGGV